MRRIGKFIGCGLIAIFLLTCTACSGFDRLSDNLKDGAEQLSDDVVIGIIPTSELYRLFKKIPLYQWF